MFLPDWRNIGPRVESTFVVILYIVNVFFWLQSWFKLRAIAQVNRRPGHWRHFGRIGDWFSHDITLSLVVVVVVVVQLLLLLPEMSCVKTHYEFYIFSEEVNWGQTWIRDELPGQCHVKPYLKINHYFCWEWLPFENDTSFRSRCFEVYQHLRELYLKRVCALDEPSQLHLWSAASKSCQFISF